MKGRKFGRSGCIYERGMKGRGIDSLSRWISGGEFWGRAVNTLASPTNKGLTQGLWISCLQGSRLCWMYQNGGIVSGYGRHRMGTCIEEV